MSADRDFKRERHPAEWVGSHFKQLQIPGQRLDDDLVVEDADLLRRVCEPDRGAEGLVSNGDRLAHNRLSGFEQGDVNALSAQAVELEVGLHDRAEKELAAALKANWRGPLVRLFGLVEATDTTKQLKRAEGWLKSHGEDTDLLLAAARLCQRNELWGKARSYLETVISMRPTPEAYQEYGALLTQMGEADAAADAYRDGLGMVAAKPLPAITHVTEE